MKKDSAKKLRMHSLLSLLITVIGTALLTFMIVVEDEPGAIPLLLIAIGAGWYFITRYRRQSQPGQG